MGKGTYSIARFCPKCGVESVVRDVYESEKIHAKMEFICNACGFAFALSPSTRHQLANRIFKEHRARSFEPKPEPSYDKELVRLRCWIDDLGIGFKVRRYMRDNKMFVFESPVGGVGKATNYERALSFMAGVTEGLKLNGLASTDIARGEDRLQVDGDRVEGNRTNGGENGTEV